MTDEQDQTPFQAKESRRPRPKRQDEVSNPVTTDGPTKAPPLNPGPGRTRILDPDQRTLEENIRRLSTFASVQATLDETAAGMNVSLDTLRAFFQRYPTVKEMYDDLRHTGVASIRVNLYHHLAKDPATARFMAERIGGIESPHKRKELELRERALAQQQEEFRQSIELRNRKLTQRERAQNLREQQSELNTKPFGAGPPIDVSTLTPTQLVHLFDRIRAFREAKMRLMFDGTKQPPGDTESGPIGSS